LVTLLVVLLAPSAAIASSSLVLSRADLTTLGLHPAPVSAASARAQLVAGLSGGVGSSLDGAQIEASAASAGGQRLDSYAFVPRSSAVARRILTSWRQVHRAQSVKVGAGGAVFAEQSKQRAAVQVLWRDGPRLGLIVLSATQDLGGTTAWGKVLAEVRPDGTVSKQTALQAFAVAFGALPGVHPPPGARAAIPSGTLASD